MDDGKPLLAVCRGIQVLNVALGGSLYQDIQTQIQGPASMTTAIPATRVTACPT